VESEPLGGFGLQQSIEDLDSVLQYMHEELGEHEVHIFAHGFGGVLVMEALLKARLRRTDSLRIRSVILLGTPSDADVADAEARRLMAEATDIVGLEDAAQSFWFRHVCALRPQPSCLADAYSQGADGPASQWRGFGALRGWDLRNADLTDIADDLGRTWRLRGDSILKGWRAERPDVQAFYASDNAPPLLCLRGEHDFVTEACLDAWRGADDASGSELRYREQTIGGCGHNAHLENPEATSAQIRLWLLDVEDNNPSRSSSIAQGLALSVTSEAPQELGKWTFLAQSEARARLNGWASELSWQHQRSPPEKPGAWRSMGQGLPHRAVYAPSRSARRLAEWARKLPAAQSSSQIASAEAVAEIREVFARAQTVQRKLQIESKPRLALALIGNDEISQKTEAQQVKAIVCVEAENPSSPRIVGAAAAPDLPSEVREGAVRQVTTMLSKATNYYW